MERPRRVTRAARAAAEGSPLRSLELTSKRQKKPAPPRGKKPLDPDTTDRADATSSQPLAVQQPITSPSQSPQPESQSEQEKVPESRSTSPPELHELPRRSTRSADRSMSPSTALDMNAKKITTPVGVKNRKSAIKGKAIKKGPSTHQGAGTSTKTRFGKRAYTMMDASDADAEDAGDERRSIKRSKLHSTPEQTQPERSQLEHSQIERSQLEDPQPTRNKLKRALDTTEDEAKSAASPNGRPVKRPRKDSEVSKTRTPPRPSLSPRSRFVANYKKPILKPTSQDLNPWASTPATPPFGSSRLADVAEFDTPVPKNVVTTMAIIAPPTPSLPVASEDSAEDHKLEPFRFPVSRPLPPKPSSSRANANAILPTPRGPTTINITDMPGDEVEESFLPDDSVEEIEDPKLKKQRLEAMGKAAKEEAKKVISQSKKIKLLERQIEEMKAAAILKNTTEQDASSANRTSLSSDPLPLVALREDLSLNPPPLVVFCENPSKGYGRIEIYNPADEAKLRRYVEKLIGAHVEHYSQNESAVSEFESLSGDDTQNMTALDSNITTDNVDATTTQLETVATPVKAGWITSFKTAIMTPFRFTGKSATANAPQTEFSYAHAHNIAEATPTRPQRQSKPQTERKFTSQSSKSLGERQARRIKSRSAIQHKRHGSGPKTRDQTEIYSSEDEVKQPQHVLGHKRINQTRRRSSGNGNDEVQQSERVLGHKTRNQTRRRSSTSSNGDGLQQPTNSESGPQTNDQTRLQTPRLTRESSEMTLQSLSAKAKEFNEAARKARGDSHEMRNVQVASEEHSAADHSVAEQQGPQKPNAIIKPADASYGVAWNSNPACLSDDDDDLEPWVPEHEVEKWDANWRDRGYEQVLNTRLWVWPGTIHRDCLAWFAERDRKRAEKQAALTEETPAATSIDRHPTGTYKFTESDSERASDEEDSDDTDEEDDSMADASPASSNVVGDVRVGTALPATQQQSSSAAAVVGEVQVDATPSTTQHQSSSNVFAQVGATSSAAQEQSSSSVLQPSKWEQTPPPPKPKMSNAQLPATTQVAPAFSRQYVPKNPSRLRNVTAMSPIQEEPKDRAYYMKLLQEKKITIQEYSDSFGDAYNEWMAVPRIGRDVNMSATTTPLRVVQAVSKTK